MKNTLVLMIGSLCFGFSAFAVDPFFISQNFPKTGGMALVSNISGYSASLVAFDEIPNTV